MMVPLPSHAPTSDMKLLENGELSAKLPQDGSEYHRLLRGEAQLLSTPFGTVASRGNTGLMDLSG